MLYFKSLLLNEWPTFRIYRFLFRIWHVLKLLKTHISLENFVMIFLTLLPLKLNTLAENGPYDLSCWLLVLNISKEIHARSAKCFEITFWIIKMSNKHCFIVNNDLFSNSFWEILRTFFAENLCCVTIIAEWLTTHEQELGSAHQTNWHACKLPLLFAILSQHHHNLLAYIS